MGLWSPGGAEAWQRGRRGEERRGEEARRREKGDERREEEWARRQRRQDPLARGASPASTNSTSYQRRLYTVLDACLYLASYADHTSHSHPLTPTYQTSPRNQDPRPSFPSLAFQFFQFRSRCVKDIDIHTANQYIPNLYTSLPTTDPSSATKPTSQRRERIQGLL